MKINKKILLLLVIFALVSCQGGAKHKVTTYVNYFYDSSHDFIIDAETGEKIPIATPLFNYRHFYFNAEDSKKIPAIPYDFLIPGDRFQFEYYGSEVFSCDLIYPPHCAFDGSLISAQYLYTSVVEIDEDSIVRNESGGIDVINNYVAYDQYVIIASDLRFLPLAEYKGETLFASVDSSRILTNGNNDKSIPEPRAIGALFSFNPRPNTNV